VIRLALILTLTGCAGQVGVERDSDTRMDAGADTTDAPASSFAPACTEVPALPSAGPTPCATGGCAVDVITTGVDGAFTMIGDSTHLYFTSGRAIGATTITRADKATFAKKTLATKQTYVFGLALLGEHLYFGNLDNATPPEWGVVARVLRDGSAEPEILRREPYVQHIAVDDRYIFWSGNELVRSRLDGSDRTVLAPLAVGVVAHGDWLYFTEYPAPMHFARVPKSGGATQRLLDGTARYSFTFESGWNVFADGLEVASIVRTPIDCVGPRIAIATGQKSPTAIATIDGWVYWAERSGALRRAPLSGGPTVTLVTVPFKNVRSLVVDDKYVWWADADAGVIARTLR